MAVQTIKATIQMRKGAEQNFDPSQMTAGEWAVSTDSKKVWMCFSPGIVRRMATYEAFEQDMREIQLILATCQNIQAAVERFMQLAQQHSTQAEEWSVTSKSWAVGGTGTRKGENTNNSQFWSNQSKAEADRAKEEADRAAAITGIDIMTGATASAAGKAGLAPAPGAGKQNAYLRGDGTWVAPATTLTGTVAGIPLDQTMGKKLDDKISVINSNLNLYRSIPHTPNNTYILSESGFVFERRGKLAIFEGRVRLQQLINQFVVAMQITNEQDYPCRQIMTHWISDSREMGVIKILPTGEIQFSHNSTSILQECWAFFNCVYVCND